MILFENERSMANNSGADIACNVSATVFRRKTEVPL